MKALVSCLAGPLLGLALACGGGNTTVPEPPVHKPAVGLTYTDPNSNSWRLVKDPASSPTRLVLSLVGPSGLKSRGVGFNLQAPPAVKFGTFTKSNVYASYTGWPINDTGVYELRNTDPRDPWTGLPVPQDPLEPILLSGGIKKGNVLTVGIFQKDRRATAKDSGAPLCQIAIEFDGKAGLKADEELPLKVLKAKYIAEDIGAFATSPTIEMVDKGHLQTITIALGVLRAN